MHIKTIKPKKRKHIMTQVDDVKPPRNGWKNHHYDENLSITDTYATILKFNAVGARHVLIIKNTGNKNALYSVYGSIKDVDDIPIESDDSWAPLVTDKAINAGIVKWETLFFSWSFIYVQMKCVTPSDTTTAKAWTKGD